MNGAEAADAGVVDENVDGVEFLESGVDEGSDLIGARDVGGKGEGVDGFAAEARGRVFEGFFVASAKADARAHLAEAASDGKTDASAGARDESGLSGERIFSGHHALLTCFLFLRPDRGDCENRKSKVEARKPHPSRETLPSFVRVNRMGHPEDKRQRRNSARRNARGDVWLVFIILSPERRRYLDDRLMSAQY